MELRMKLKMALAMLLVVVVMFIAIAHRHIVASRINEIRPDPWIVSTNSAPRADVEKERHLLVLFTTFKENSPHHVFAHSVAIANWASLGNGIKPVLFADLKPNDKLDGLDLTRMAFSHGWDVLPIPSRNKHGTPHLKSMFGSVFGRYEAAFYGYANGDLLFDEALLKSLVFVATIMNDHLSGNVLMVGRRTEVILRVPQEVINSTNTSVLSPVVDQLREEFNRSKLHKLASTGFMRSANAIDYFLFTKTGSSFRWDVTADVVVGRRSYDQYLIVKAAEYGVNLIDLSGIVSAIHLSKPGVPDTSLENADAEYNREIISRRFPQSLGTTLGCNLFLAEDALDFGRIVLAKRKSEMLSDQPGN